jgi:hypothetical protein
MFDQSVLGCCLSKQQVFLARGFVQLVTGGANPQDRVWPANRFRPPCNQKNPQDPLLSCGLACRGGPRGTRRAVPEVRLLSCSLAGEAGPRSTVPPCSGWVVLPLFPMFRHSLDSLPSSVAGVFLASSPQCDCEAGYIGAGLLPNACCLMAEVTDHAVTNETDVRHRMPELMPELIKALLALNKNAPSVKCVVHQHCRLAAPHCMMQRA